MEKIEKKVNENNKKTNDVEKSVKKIEEENRDTSQDTKVFTMVKTVNVKKEEKKLVNSENHINKETNEIKKEEKNTEEIVKENKNTYKTLQGDNKKRKILKILLLIIFLTLIITIFSTVFGLLYRNSTEIINGVYINNINVSNLTKEEAIEKLQNELNNNEKNFITVNAGEYSRNIYLENIEGKFNIQDAVETAYNIGRTGNLVQNNYKIFGTMIAKCKINMSFTYNQELLDNIIDEVSLEIPGIATNSSYVIQDNNLIIKDGTAGKKINKNEFIGSLINSFGGTEKQFEVILEDCEKQPIDIEKIYAEVYKEPINAYYKTNPYTIYKEEPGLDFAISLEEVKQMLLEEKAEYTIPLRTVQAKIKVTDLDLGAFPDELASFTTKYGTGDKNRNTNIALAAKSINTVLMPGEVFSYNDLIGECSARTGYKPAAIYLNGKVATGIGGGICQVSTTLYNAVLRANLEVVDRRNHSMSVAYVPLGQDAMVSTGSQDFKFKNNRDYPIRVVATVGTGSITCKIYGLKQDVEYDVKLYSTTISRTETRYKVQTYKILYLNGKEVSRTLISTDTYKYPQKAE